MRRALKWLPGLIALAVLWSVIAHPWGWLYGIGVHPYPASSSTPWTYQMLSGFVPALAVLTLLSAVGGMWRSVNCHEPRCWRLGRHKVHGTPWCDHHQETARPELTENEILQQILTEVSLLRDALTRDDRT